MIRDREAGLTIIELAVVSALFLLIGGVVLAFLNSAQRVESFATDEVNATDDLRLAIEQFARDARQARAVTEATCTKLVMTSYSKAGTQRSVTYEIAGTKLTRTLGTGPAGTLVSKLQAAKLYASSALGCPSGSPKKVRLDMSVLPVRSKQPVSLTATVSMRNA